METLLVCGRLTCWRCPHHYLLEPRLKTYENIKHCWFKTRKSKWWECTTTPAKPFLRHWKFACDSEIAWKVVRCKACITLLCLQLLKWQTTTPMLISLWAHHTTSSQASSPAHSHLIINGTHLFAITLLITQVLGCQTYFVNVVPALCLRWFQALSSALD